MPRLVYAFIILAYLDCSSVVWGLVTSIALSCDAIYCTISTGYSQGVTYDGL